MSDLRARNVKKDETNGSTPVQKSKPVLDKEEVSRPSMSATTTVELNDIQLDRKIKKLQTTKMIRQMLGMIGLLALVVFARRVCLAPGP